MKSDWMKMDEKWPHPLFKPPFGRVTAIDMQLWSKCLGLPNALLVKDRLLQQLVELINLNFRRTPKIFLMAIWAGLYDHTYLFPQTCFLLHRKQKEIFTGRSLFRNDPPHIFPYRLNS